MSRKNEILLLALPVIMENILQTLLGTTDTYFAGQLADEAIAGIGVTSLIMNIFISFFTAVSVGTTAVTARAFGAGDREKANRTVIHSVLLALVLGLAVGLVCGLFAKPILRISGAEEVVLSYLMLCRITWLSRCRLQCSVCSWYFLPVCGL